MGRRWTLTLSLVVTGAVLASAVAAGARVRGAGGVPTAKADPKGILRIATDLSTFGGPSFDPITTKGSPLDFDWDAPMYDTLVHVAKDGSFAPGLATSWKIRDAQTVELQLRKNVTFHDGTPFNSDAVKAGLLRSLDSNNRAMPESFFALESVDATSPLSVTLHLREPAMDSFFPTLHSLATFIPSPAAISKGDLATHPVGAGPFTFESLTTEQKLSERKWSGYWNAKAIRFAGLDFIQTATGPSTVNALLTDQVDLVTLSNTADAKAVGGRAGVKLFEQPSPANTYLITMCLSKPPFDKLKVRQAIAHAVDRTAINQGALDGLGFPSPLPVRQGSQFYFPDLARKNAHDPKLAKRLLKQAGATNLTFEFLEPPVPSFLRVAEVVQGELKEVGVDAKIVQSTNVVQDLFIDNKAPAAVLYTTSAGLPGLLPYLGSEGLANLCHYKNAKVDQAVAQIQSSLGDNAKLMAAWRQLEATLVNDLPLVFLASPTVVLGLQDRVHGVNQIFESGGTNLEGVYLTK